MTSLIFISRLPENDYALDRYENGNENCSNDKPICVKNYRLHAWTLKPCGCNVIYELPKMTSYAEL